MDDGYRWDVFCNMYAQCLQDEQRQESLSRKLSMMIEELAKWNEQLAEQSTSLARNPAIIDQMEIDNEKTSGATIELDDSTNKSLIILEFRGFPTP